MRLKTAVLTLSLAVSSLALVSAPALADSLTLTGVGGASSDGVYVYPYVFTVTEGTQTVADVLLSCLNYNREITVGETWKIDESSVPLGNGTLDGESDASFRADAWLNTQYGNPSYTATEVQFAIWSIMDSTDVNAGAHLNGFDATAQTLAATALANANTLPSSFFANDVLFIPDPTGAPWTPTEPQIFIAAVNPVPAPEPSTLLLFGTGLLGTGLIMQRRMREMAAAHISR